MLMEQFFATDYSSSIDIASTVYHGTVYVPEVRETDALQKNLHK